MWASPITVAAPAVEPVDLASAKEFLRIDADDTSFDVELASTIAGVRSEIERISSTRLITQTVELIADSFADLAHLPIGPAQSIVSIEYQDAVGAPQAIAPADVELTGACLEQGMCPVAGKTWPSGAVRARSIRITIAVGYGDDRAAVPEDLIITLLRGIRAMFDDYAIDLAPMLTNHRIWL